MTPRSRQVALQGVGYGSRVMALQGFTAPRRAAQQIPTVWPSTRRKRRRREEVEALLLTGAL